MSRATLIPQETIRDAVRQLEAQNPHEDAIEAAGLILELNECDCVNIYWLGVSIQIFAGGWKAAVGERAWENIRRAAELFGVTLRDLDREVRAIVEQLENLINQVPKFAGDQGALIVGQEGACTPAATEDCDTKIFFTVVDIWLEIPVHGVVLSVRVRARFRYHLDFRNYKPLRGTRTGMLTPPYTRHGDLRGAANPAVHLADVADALCGRSASWLGESATSWRLRMGSPRLSRGESETRPERAGHNSRASSPSRLAAPEAANVRGTISSVDVVPDDRVDSSRPI